MASYDCRGKKKLWSVRFEIIEDGEVKMKRLSGFDRKKDAHQAYIQFMETYKQRRNNLKNNTISFLDLYNEYKIFAKTKLKESSFYDFCSKSDLHIKPYFENFTNVKEITPKIILKWQQTISKYSYKYKINLRTYLSSILRYAERYYNIINQLKFVDTFRNIDDIHEMQIYTPEEFNKFIEEVDKIEYKAFFYALYYTGARKGELLATNWSDWNLKDGYLKITKTISKKVFDKPFAITKPKNQTSIRKISIPKNLINIMQELKNVSQQTKFVFYGDKPLADSSIGRVRDEACLKANLKAIRIHDFRHSHASLLFSKGITPMAVAKRLGHKDIKETFNTYSHMMPAEEKKLLNMLERI